MIFLSPMFMSHYHVSQERVVFFHLSNHGYCNDINVYLGISFYINSVTSFLLCEATIKDEKNHCLSSSPQATVLSSVEVIN